MMMYTKKVLKIDLFGRYMLNLKKSSRRNPDAVQLWLKPKSIKWFDLGSV